MINDGTGFPLIVTDQWEGMESVSAGARMI